MDKKDSFILFPEHTADLDQCPTLSLDRFRHALFTRVEQGHRVAALFCRAFDEKKNQLIAVTADGQNGRFHIFQTEVEDEYPSLTPVLPAVHLFEREIFEQSGVVPIGHPWLKPVRQPSGRSSAGHGTEFFSMKGEEIHEVAVGPIHAGVIEPGHFRFQCFGEIMKHVEIMLGFQHRGIERAMMGTPNQRSIHYMETLAGDTTVGNTTAYCQIIEALAGIKIPPGAQALRAVALELERIANHVGDLGAMAGDVGFLPTASYCGRLRGRFLNMTAMLCGNRYGRGMIVPGGMAFSLDERQIALLLADLKKSFSQVEASVNLLWDRPSVLSRFDQTGILTKDVCLKLGLVGLTARASGLKRDARVEFPSGFYQFSQLPMAQWDTGDVYARALVRWLEIKHSAAFIESHLKNLAPPTIFIKEKPLRPNALAAAMVEGWRGEIFHIGITDHEGKFLRYKIVDPSFHNWFGVSIALRNEQIADFPICNKSFNLSYCGFDS